MYDESTYGDSIADIYDELYGPVSASEVDLLAELAGIGPALELGIGTGRVSIPLAGKGLEVWGIDSSQAMLDKVVEGPGGAGVQVVIGNMADVDVDRHFQLVFVVTHTLFCLREQSEQLRCFENVARRLTPDGLFVVHAFVPNLTWWSNGQSVETQALGIDRVWIEASFHKAATQEIDSRYVILGPNSVQVHPVKLRYIWPSEMDMMAKAAGMRLRNRWGGWKKQPFTSGSATHVSVYEREARSAT